MNNYSVKCVQFVNSVLARVPHIGSVDFSLITGFLQQGSAASILPRNWFAGLLGAIGGNYFYNFHQEKAARKRAQDENLRILSDMDDLRANCDICNKNLEEERCKNRQLLEDIGNRINAEDALKKRVHNLQKDLANDKVKHLQDLLDMEEAANNRIQMVEEKLHDLASENTAFKKTLEKNKDIVLRQQQELDDMNSLLTAKHWESERERLQNEELIRTQDEQLQADGRYIQELERTVHGLEIARDGLQESLNEREAENYLNLQKANDKIAKVEREVQLCLNEKKDVTEKMETAEAALRKDFDAQAQKLEKALAYIQQLESENEELKNVSEKNKESIVKHQKEIDELNGLITKQELELHEMEKRTNSLENERSSLQKRLEEENRSANQRAEELESRNRDLVDEMDQTKAACQKRIRELGGEFLQAQTMRNLAEDHLEQEKGRRRQIELQIELQKENMEWEKELAAMENEKKLNDLQDINDALRMKLELASKRYHELLEEITQRDNNEIALEQKIQKLEKKMASEKTNHSRELMNVMKDAEEGMRKAESERKALKFAYEELERRNEDLERRNEDLERTNAKEDSVIRKQRQLMKDIYSRLDEVQAEMRDMAGEELEEDSD